MLTPEQTSLHCGNIDFNARRFQSFVRLLQLAVFECFITQYDGSHNITPWLSAYGSLVSSSQHI
jgi:hypothetical protein